MASFLNLNDDAIIEIAQLGADATGKNDLTETCTSLVEKENYEQLYTTLFAAADKVLDTIASESDVEVFFLVLNDILLKLAKNDDKIQQLIKLITSSTSAKTTLRLKLIVNVLNSLPHTHALHFKIFLQALQYAKDTKQSNHVLKYSGLIDSMMNEWNTSVEDRRSVYLVFYDILSEVQQRNESFAIITKYLATFTAKDTTDVAISYATKAVVEAIQLDYRFDDLFQLAPVQQLASKDAKLYELLNIFLRGSVADFEKFATSNKDVITKHNLSQDELTNKMRLLTITSLCAKGTEAISYASLAKELNIDENMVESYIIQAIGQGIIDARLNQLNRTVTFMKTVYREFTTQEWKHLGDKISNWQNNIDSMLQTIRTKKEEAVKSGKK